MERITVLIVSILFISEIASQHQAGSCNLATCYPKLTTNSSKLNALLVFGIFEVPLHEKCLMFAQADQCFESLLSSCQGQSKARKFHVDSWQNAKKLFDYICVEEYIDFNENQACLKELALSSGIQKCDSYFSFKTSGNAVCDLPSVLSKCVEHETSQMCPGEGAAMVPKIVKMVDMFLNDMININSSVCSPGQYTTTEGPKTRSEVEIKDLTKFGHHFEKADEGIVHIPKHSSTDPPVHTFVVTRRYHGSRRTFIPKRRKDDEDDDDDSDLDDIGPQKTGQHNDLWKNENRRGGVGTANTKAHDVHRHHHHHRHRGHLDSNRTSNASHEIDAEDEFGRRHRLKPDQERLTSNKEPMVSSFVLLASSNIITLILQSLI